MRLRSLVLALLTTVLAASFVLPSNAAEVPDPFDPRAVDDYVSDYLDRHGLPGATVAVVKDGELVHEGGYGEDSNGRQLTEDSRLRIASVSKSFTAFAVLQLVDRGLVDLDGPVVDYLPDFRVDDDRVGDITVRQLLSHTSGLTTPTIIPPAGTLAEGVDRTRDWQPLQRPGLDLRLQQRELLGVRPAGRGGVRRVVRRLRRPTRVRPARHDEHREHHDVQYAGRRSCRRTRHRLRPRARYLGTGADGQRRGRHRQHGARHGDVAGDATTRGAHTRGRQVLSSSLVEESHAPQPHADGAGFGWMRSAEGTTPERISHSGVSPTFNAQQDLVPESGYAVVVMLNSFTPSREHAYEISSGIIELTEGDEPDIGLPVATLIDVALGLLTLLALLLGWRGIRSAVRWSERRKDWAWWRFGLRLLPQLIAPAVAVFLFLVAPVLQHNSFTTANVLLLFPALMVLLVGAATVGVVVTVARVARRAQLALKVAATDRRETGAGRGVTPEPSRASTGVRPPTPGSEMVTDQRVRDGDEFEIFARARSQPAVSLGVAALRQRPRGGGPGPGDPGQGLRPVATAFRRPDRQSGGVRTDRPGPRLDRHPASPRLARAAGRGGARRRRARCRCRVPPRPPERARRSRAARSRGAGAPLPGRRSRRRCGGGAGISPGAVRNRSMRALERVRTGFGTSLSDLRLP